MDKSGEEYETTSQEKDGNGCDGEEKKGAAQTEMDRQQPRRYEKYDLTADMTENRQFWKMMVKTGPQRSGDDL